MYSTYNLTNGKEVDLQKQWMLYELIISSRWTCLELNLQGSYPSSVVLTELVKQTWVLRCILI